MRIIYLDQYFKTRDTAGGTRGYEFMRILSRFGHDIVVVTSDRTGDRKAAWRITNEDGIEVHWVSIAYSNKMSVRRRVVAFLRFAVMAAVRASRIGGDIVFATSTPLTIALPAIWTSKRLGVPMVFEVRDLWPELPIAVGALRNPISKMLARRLERIAYRNSARIIALSPGMKDGVVRSGYPANLVHVIPNCSDIDFFRVPQEHGMRWRQEHPEIADRPVVMYAGTLGQINGVSWLVRVAHAADGLAPGVCFVVVGDGRDREKVEREAQELGVLGKNFFLFPPVPKLAVPSLLSAATVCASLFLDIREMWNNSANKFFDALAAGRPLAINYEGWQAELLRESSAGIVLPGGDVEGAARMLISRVLDKDWLPQAGIEAGRLAERYFDRNKLVNELNNVLESARETGRNSS